MIKNIAILSLLISLFCLSIRIMKQNDDCIELVKKHVHTLVDSTKETVNSKRYFVISYNWKNANKIQGSAYCYVQSSTYPSMKQLNSSFPEYKEIVILNIIELTKADYAAFLY